MIEPSNKALIEAIANIKPVSAQIAADCIERFDQVAKPLGSLGLLEDLIARIAAVEGTIDVAIDRKAVVVFCADNGVLKHRTALHTYQVTTAIADILAKGRASVSMMAKAAGAEVLPIDIGMVETVENIRNCKLMHGTEDMTVGPAMSRATAEQAIAIGIDIVRELKQQGIQLIATGEAGIGNTTTSSAVCAALLGRTIEESTGRGAGLDDEGLSRKLTAIEQALACNQPDAADPVDVLHKVGGLDIAGMVGLYLGAALYGLPVVMDGFISSVAALLAVRLCATVLSYIIPSHISSEPGAQLIVNELGLAPIIHAQMRLGEGTGAVALFPVLDMVLAVYRDAATYADIM